MKEHTKDVKTAQSGNSDGSVQCIDLTVDDDTDLVQEILGEENEEDEQLSEELNEIIADLCSRTDVEEDQSSPISPSDNRQKLDYKNMTSRNIDGSDEKNNSISSKNGIRSTSDKDFNLGSNNNNKRSLIDVSSANKLADNEDTFIDFFDNDLIKEFAMETSTEDTLKKIPKAVNKNNTNSSSYKSKNITTTKPTKFNDRKYNSDRNGRKPPIKITLSGVEFKSGKKDDPIERRKEDKPYAKGKDNAIKPPVKRTQFTEVVGEDIKDGIFTRVVIVGEYFISYYKAAWPQDCEVYPFFLYKKDICVDSLYSEIRDHYFMRNSKKILVLFVLGFHDVSKYSDMREDRCSSSHRKFRILEDICHHYNDNFKYIASMRSLKLKIEADKTFSAIFCYLPYVNFYESISRVYKYIATNASSCSCFHEIKKAKLNSELRPFKSRADINIKTIWKMNREIFSRNLNETKEGIFEFLPFDIFFADSWLSVETSTSSQIKNNIKQLSMMLSKYTLGKGGTVAYETTHSLRLFMGSKLDGNVPVRIVFVGDTWMKGLAEKWPSRDQIQPFFYCKDDMTLNDIKNIIISLNGYNEELLVITSVPSGELFSTVQYSHCKNHTPLRYPTVQRYLLEEPKMFADKIRKKIDSFQLDIKQHIKKCHVVFLTCYPVLFNTCYKFLFEQHIASHSLHNQNDDPFKTMGTSYLDDKVMRCLRPLNIYLENLNKEKNCPPCDIFGFVSKLRLSFPNMLMFPAYQYKQPSEITEQLLTCILPYTRSLYKLLVSKKLKQTSARVVSDFKSYSKQDEERSQKQNSLTEYLHLFHNNTDNQKIDNNNFGSQAANFQNEASYPEKPQENLVTLPQHFYDGSSVSFYSGQQQQHQSYHQESNYVNRVSQENIAVYPQAFFNAGVAPNLGQQYCPPNPAYANFMYDKSSTSVPLSSQIIPYANIPSYSDQGSSNTIMPASTSYTSSNTQKSITEQLREELCGTTNVDAYTKSNDGVDIQGLPCVAEKLEPTIYNSREKRQSKSRSKERSKSKGREEKLRKSGDKERRHSRSRSRSKERRHNKSRSRSREKRRSRNRSRSKERRRSKSRSRSKERRHRRSRSKERRRSKSRNFGKRKSKDEFKSKSKKHSSERDNRSTKRSKRSSSLDAVFRDCKSEKEKTTIAKLWKRHVKECEIYFANPETHPDHDRMKQMYMHVVRSQGLMSADAGNDHWNECWKKKMTSLLQESWEEKKNKCLDDLSLKSQRKDVSRRRSSSTSSSSSPSSSSSSSSSSASSSSYSDSRRMKNRKHKSTSEAKHKGKSKSAKETTVKNIDPPARETLDSTVVAENVTLEMDLPHASTPPPMLSEEKSPDKSLSVSSQEQGCELLLSTFSILCQLSERLGALGLSLKLLNAKALESTQMGMNPYDCMDEDSEMLLSLIHTKLKENIKDPNLSLIQKSIIQEAESRLHSVLTYNETRKTSSDTVDIESLAKLTFGMQVADVIEFIRAKLKRRGRGVISNDELMTIYLQVKSQQVQLVTKKANSGTTAINL